MSEITDQSISETSLPKGTVTFLFTDIEGSTRLLEQLREQYATLLQEQRDILRATFANWNGIEIDTQGDSFFVAFPRAIEAINSAIDAQRALSAHNWPGRVAVRVRMGIHTGEPIVVRTGYVGMDVHRAARVAHAGHGGQVLVSQATQTLIYQDLPAGVNLLDLGEYKLKDIRYPQRIFQLTIEGLPSEFPALKTLSVDEEPPTPGEPPYKGLQYFTESDAEWFFGRQAVTARLLEAVKKQPFLAVVGASGSGKSSVVRAGLLPALKREPARHWQVYTITPTTHPLEALAISLTRQAESVTATASLIDDLQRDSRSLHLYILKSLTSRGESLAGSEGTVLLVIDQFEELFTQCREAGERQVFVDNLLHTVHADGGSAKVLITLRADFYEHVAQYPDLREAISTQQIYIGAMSAAELRQAIEEPAKLGGWELSPGLVDLILHDTGAGENRQPEPGALPLLSHALLETWKRRRGNLMSLRAYTEAGGVRGAIAHTADRVYLYELNSEQQEIARSIFLRLTELGEGTQDTRRRISISELIPPGPALETEQIRSVLLKLADARLITTGEDTVEVAHEALIREWPALREWLSQDREGLRLHRHLTEAAAEWELLERDPGALYRGARLAQALEWALNHPRQLNLQEQAFLNASQVTTEQETTEREAARQRELEAARKLAEAEHQRAEEQAHSARRLRQRALLLAIALVATLGLAAAAIFFFNQANQNADLAKTRQAEAESNANLAATNAADARQQQALAEEQAQARATQQAIAELAAQDAYARELSQAAEANLENDPELSMLLELEAISVSQTAGLPVLPSMEDILHRAMQASRARLTITHPGGAWGIDLSPDGTLLATAGNDGTIRLWDAQSGQLTQTLSGHSAPVGDVEFSPDGQHLASFSDDNTARIWDLASGETIQTLSDTAFISYSPDGNKLVTVDYSSTGESIVRIWDVSSGPTPGQLLLELPGQENPLDFSPDGVQLATTSVDDKQTRIWDVQTGRELLILPTETETEDTAMSVDFSPDGSRLAVEGSLMGMVTIFDVVSGEQTSRLCCHPMRVSADFNPDGSMVATAGQEGVARIWDANNGSELFTLSGNMGAVQDQVFNPQCGAPPQAPFTGCGRYLYTASRDGTIKQWDVSPAGNRDWLTVQGVNAAFTPDGKQFEVINLITNPDFDSPNQVAIQSWQIQPRGEPELGDNSQLPPLPAPIVAGNVAVFPDKTIVLIASWDGSVQTWEVGNPQGMTTYSVPISPGEGKWIAGVYAPPQGLRMITMEYQGSTHIWDIASGEVLLSVPASGAVNLSPDGSLLAFGGEDGLVSLWKVPDGEKLLTIAAHAQPVVSLSFSPDSQHLVTGSMDTTARVWNLSNGQELFTLTHPATANNPIFSPDGRRVAVNHPDGSLYLWDVDPDSPTSGQLLATFTGLETYPVFNGFNPDGTIVFNGGWFDQRVRLYILPLDDLVSLTSSRLTRNWTQAECQRYRIEPCP